jgi:hypothetical protein
MIRNDLLNDNALVIGETIPLGVDVALIISGISKNTFNKLKRIFFF